MWEQKSLRCWSRLPIDQIKLKHSFFMLPLAYILEATYLFTLKNRNSFATTLPWLWKLYWSIIFIPFHPHFSSLKSSFMWWFYWYSCPLVILNWIGCCLLIAILSGAEKNCISSPVASNALFFYLLWESYETQPPTID